jgi:large subunit ribosomal protein L29
VKSTKYLESLKDKSVEELNVELVNTKKELFNLRFQNATNQLDNTARINEVRKNIARILTVMSQLSWPDGQQPKRKKPKRTRNAERIKREKTK